MRDIQIVDSERKARMHTVPRSYLEAFAVKDAARRSPSVWRFDLNGNRKQVGVTQAEVVKHFYTVFRENGEADTGIEDILSRIEGNFCPARDALLKQEPLDKAQRTAFARFVAAQLLRTPRFFQAVRNMLEVDRFPYTESDLRGAMLVLIDRWIPRLTRMNAIYAYNETGVPLLTSDNPAAAWRKEGDDIICGLFHKNDPQLTISCPLSPTLAFIAYHTPESLSAAYAENHDTPPQERLPASFKTHVDCGTLPEAEVRRLNQVCVANAHKYVYSNECSAELGQFLRNTSLQIKTLALRQSGD